MDVKEYVTRDGRRPVSEWVDGLKDANARERIFTRIDRLELGLPGDWKSIGGALCELRVDIGPGYRIYFARERRNWLLLYGGDKSRQQADIRRAHEFWEEYKSRTKSAVQGE
jgi:putative addiction module killer protein